jgi:uncharacterized membrane protein YbhN (UPF0104 family)
MHIRIIDILLALSCLTLLFQIFPSAFWTSLAIVDLRNWTWRSYAVVSTVAIVTLVTLRAWSERDA